MPEEPPAPPAETAPSSDELSGSNPDPHGFTEFARGLSNTTQKRAKAAVVAAAMVLESGEVVRDFVCGQYLGHDGVAVLTDRRLILANNRTFSPEVQTVPASDVTAVKGWVEGKRATLRITANDVEAVLGDIAEVDRAQEFAQALRSIG